MLLLLAALGQFDPPPPSPSPFPTPPLPPGAPPPPDLVNLPNNRAESNLHSARLRKHILARDQVDRLVPPTSVRSNGYSTSGTDVALQLRVFKLIDVSPATGLMQLKVWVRMSWSDTRLAWNISEYGDITQTTFQGEAYAGAETSEIWTPDITAYNALHGMAANAEPAIITVNNFGHAYFSRPMLMDVMCKFSGLVAFPFDTLKCTTEFGGWGMSGYQQGITLLDGGVALSSEEVTSGTSYQQFSIKSANVTTRVYKYPCCPNEPWPAVVYTFEMSRAGNFYTILTIVPGIVITLLSFSVFFTDTASSDPMSYGITVIVVNLLSTLVLVSMLPVCGELICIDLFSFVNTAFCCISLFQSAFNAMLEKSEDTYLLPVWINYLSQYLYAKSKKALMPAWQRAKRGFRKPPPPSDPHADDLKKLPPPPASSSASPPDPFELLSSADALIESCSGLLYRQHKALGSSFASSPLKHDRRGDMSNTELAEKLTYFEKLFFEIDALNDSSGSIDKNEIEGLLSYACLDLLPAQRGKILKRFDGDGDGLLSRVEFCELCYEILWDVPYSFLDQAVNNLKLAKNGQKRRNNARWMRTADKCDKWSRTLIPCLYVLSLAVIFNINLSDNYEQAESKMFQGLGPANFSAAGGSIVALFILGACGCLLGWAIMKKISTYETEARTRRFRKAVVDSSHEPSQMAAYAQRLQSRELMNVTSSTTPKKGGKKADSTCQSSLPRPTPVRIMASGMA